MMKQHICILLASAFGCVPTMVQPTSLRPGEVGIEVGGGLRAEVPTANQYIGPSAHVALQSRWKRVRGPVFDVGGSLGWASGIFEEDSWAIEVERGAPVTVGGGFGRVGSLGGHHYFGLQLDAGILYAGAGPVIAAGAGPLWAFAAFRTLAQPEGLALIGTAGFTVNHDFLTIGLTADLDGIPAPRGRTFCLSACGRLELVVGFRLSKARE